MPHIISLEAQIEEDPIRFGFSFGASFLFLILVCVESDVRIGAFLSHKSVCGLGLHLSARTIVVSNFV